MRASILSWISYHRTQSLLYNSFWKGFSGNGCYCDWLKAGVKGFSLFPDCLRVLRLRKIRYRRHPLIFWDGWWEIGKIGSVSLLKDWKVPNGLLYSTITSTRVTWGQFSPTRNWFPAFSDCTAGNRCSTFNIFIDRYVEAAAFEFQSASHQSDPLSNKF